jgi:hypothetical protein
MTKRIDCLMMSTSSKKTELLGVTQLLQVQASGLGIHRSPRGLYGMFHQMQRLGLGYVVTDDGGELGKNRLYSIDKIQDFRQYPLVEGPAAGLWTNGATHSPPLRYQPEKLHQSPSPWEKWGCPGISVVIGVTAIFHPRRGHLVAVCTTITKLLVV